jgi:endonuclease/exonuclease/phosphatase family metal-dependent hydrolase
MSFNVRIFDLYLWTNEKNTRSNILAFLKKEQPDILCIQEFYHSDTIVNNYEFNTLDSLIQVLSPTGYHVEYTSSLRGTDHWGIITLSKYPIVRKGIVPFRYESDNICIYTDINKGGDTVRVFNAHLASIRLEKHDYKALKGLYDKKPSENFDKELMMIEKIRYGFEGRSFQADSIKKSILKSPYPVILCGDFNDTPSSYAYNTIKGNLKDAFVDSGNGLGRTYIGEFPSYRIDFIFHSDKINSLKYKTHPEKMSDHHPISARLMVE